MRDVLVPRTDSQLPLCGRPQPTPCDGELFQVVSAPAQFNLKGTGWYKPGAS
jgi:predicted nucleic acid-binding Zn ribbon protein